MGSLIRIFAALFRSGFGKELSLALLARGDKVISTARARSLPKLAELKEKGAATLELDVAAPLDELHAVAAKAVAIYGHIDVVVNNAGYMVSGTLEENTYVASSGSLLLCSALYLPQPRENLRTVQHKCFRGPERRSRIPTVHAAAQNRHHRLDWVARRVQVSLLYEQ
jgi:hypothetical protein